MKQKLYTTGIINLIVVLLGAIFKIFHFPGAGILLTIGLVSFVLLYIPAALINIYRHSQDKNSRILYIVAGLTCFLVFTAMLFKIQHWPFAGALLVIALPFPYVVFLPVFLIVTSRNNQFSIYKTVAVLLLLALNSVFSALLSLNVAKQKVDESILFSHEINNVKMSVTGTFDKAGESPVLAGIDSVLKVIDEYQGAILKYNGLTESEWNNNPEKLINADSRTAIQMSLNNYSELNDGKKLRNALNSLVSNARSTEGYKEMAKVIAEMAELPDYSENKDNFDLYFSNNFQVWTLVYLDRLETNLRLIRVSVI
ncbi:MAG TPA: hypothetical protein VHO46_09865 [Bacteroidales bacterium]|nr:hypothetical protein [Bacteroidales bacterium]